VGRLVIQIEGIWWPDNVGDKWQHAFKHVMSAEWAIDRCKHHRVAVQAGGNIGLWPRIMARYFERVVTFEPDSISRECLMKNVPDNVSVEDMALGAEITRCSMLRKSLGTHRIGPGEDVAMTTIDSMKMRVLDLLQLDIEGYELFALEGAAETILRCKPLIQVELRDNMLARYGASSDIVRAWLETMDYFQVSAQAGSDFVFECAH
jgi:FkbM family methyltransferase